MGGGIPTAQRAMPELLQMSFEAQQGVVGSAAVLFWVVPYFGKLEFSIDRKDDRVQVEDQGGSGFGQRKQLVSELIVQGNELANGFGGKPFEESPERGLIEEPGESADGLHGKGSNLDSAMPGLSVEGTRTDPACLTGW